MEAPTIITGQVFSGAAVVLGDGVGVAPLTITAPPVDAMDITCPLSVKTDPGPTVCVPMTNSVDDMTLIV